MNAQAARIIKEGRALFWPWCAVTFAGVLTWIPGSAPSSPGYVGMISSLGFWMGIPLLAALSFGNEFQHRTFPLLLSQPVDRMKVWSEKWIALAAAVLSVAGVYWLGQRSGYWLNQDFSVVSGLWIVTMVCSAMFWTLAARSTIGGIVLTLFPAMLLLVVLKFTEWFLTPGPSTEPETAVGLIGTFSVIAYGLIMLWLGRRKLARFEASGDDAGLDLLMTTPNVTVRTIAVLLQCQPTGAVLNLIRKEVRLLWPVWLLTASSVPIVLSMAAFQMLPGFSSEKLAFITLLVVSGLNGFLATVLAGSLSMGEERTAGTLSWNMTLPVSAGLQWLIKLSTAIFTSFFSIAFALGLSRLAFGEVFGKLVREALDNHPILFLFALVSLVTFASFWCACAVKGTVRAALWTFPALGSVLSATSLSAYSAGVLFYSSLLDPILSRVHPFPFAEQTARRIFNLTNQHLWLMALLLLVLVAVIQSYRLFRRELPDNIFSVIRHLLLVCAVAYLVGLTLQAPLFAVFGTERIFLTTLRETHDTIGKMGIDPATLDAAHPKQFAANDVARSMQMSATTSRLLRDATIDVVPRIGDPNWYVRNKVQTQYVTIIHFRNNWECTSYGSLFFSHCKTPTGSWGSPYQP